MDKQESSRSQPEKKPDSQDRLYIRPKDDSDKALREAAQAIAHNIVESHKRYQQSQRDKSYESKNS